MAKIRQSLITEAWGRPCHPDLTLMVSLRLSFNPVRTPVCPQRPKSFWKGHTASNSLPKPPTSPHPHSPLLSRLPECLVRRSWGREAGIIRLRLGSRGWGRGGKDSVATRSLSNAPIQQRQKRCHLSTEALQWLLFL